MAGDAQPPRIDRSRPQQRAYARQARADVLVGRMYGRVMPARLRKYLRRSTTPQIRQAVRDTIGRVVTAGSSAAEPVRSAPLLLRKRSSSVGRGATIVRWRKRAMLATVVSDLTPVQAARRNLATVRECLDAAGIPYFLVRGSEAIRFRVAVPASRREATGRALTRALASRALYLQRIEHGGEPRLATAHSIRAAVNDDYLRVMQFFTDPAHCLILGNGFGCEIEFWREETEGDQPGQPGEGAAGDRVLLAPRANLCSDAVRVAEPAVAVPESVLTPFTPRHRGEVPSYPSRAAFAEPIYSDVTFPIDVVYTWVDGEDPSWQQRRAAVAGTAYHRFAANSARFISHDELRYSLRSVWLNMPWVRTIYLVTDQQVPHWLDTEAPGIRVVDHREIFADPSVLPTFNSHAIETQLHHIPGLSEHFLYLNDDVCIGAPVVPELFFLANGASKFFKSPALVPMGKPDPEDIPSSVAGKNNRRLVEQQFGTLLTHKMKHVPHALRRSVLSEIEQEFAADHRRTAASRFRHDTDISVTSSLHHYYAFHTGRALPGDIRYSYFDLAIAETASRLRGLLARRDRQVFCLNDTTTEDGDGTSQRGLVLPFLETYFPLPSPFERADAAGT
ncbi:stealth family protein [Natronosporangium hydrolyticum]|uniref:Stealth family protein n=1 Tax=Natronosporangium hydrolyticum TaxID=2811111 RepID=A0A895YGL3_9ACTN|nr:stealth family protein [Natronosporangium hydrolyticum]